MWKSMKNGFGWAIGSLVGSAVLSIFAESCVRHIVNGGDYMERLKDRDPEQYEKIKKYQKPKKEEEKEE